MVPCLIYCNQYYTEVHDINLLHCRNLIIYQFNFEIAKQKILCICYLNKNSRVLELWISDYEQYWILGLFWFQKNIRTVCVLTITFLHILLCSGTWGALGYPPCSVITRSLAAFTILVEYWSVSMSMNSEKVELYTCILYLRCFSVGNRSSIAFLISSTLSNVDHLLGTKLN